MDYNTKTQRKRSNERRKSKGQRKTKTIAQEDRKANQKEIGIFKKSTKRKNPKISKRVKS